MNLWRKLFLFYSLGGNIKQFLNSRMIECILYILEMTNIPTIQKLFVIVNVVYILEHIYLWCFGAQKKN